MNQDIYIDTYNILQLALDLECPPGELLLCAYTQEFNLSGACELHAIRLMEGK